MPITTENKQYSKNTNSEGEKNNLFTGIFSKFDSAINTGYAKGKK